MLCWDEMAGRVGNALFIFGGGVYRGRAPNATAPPHEPDEGEGAELPVVSSRFGVGAAEAPAKPPPPPSTLIVGSEIRQIKSLR